MPRSYPTSRDRQRDAMTERVFDYICRYFGEHAFAPSLEDIGRGCHLSRASVVRYVDRLEAQGRITREPGVARSIALVEDRKRRP